MYKRDAGRREVGPPKKSISSTLHVCARICYRFMMQPVPHAIAPV